MILETRHLRLVAGIAEHGSMTRASRDLNLTQSALSHQLVTLERQLRTPLFNRLGKRMTLTAAGSRLLLVAERTLAELRLAEEEFLRAGRGQAALLRVSTECYTTYHWMPRIIKAFAERFPDVELRIVAEATSDPIAALHAGTIDVAVMMSRGVGKHLTSLPLFEDELVLVVAPDHPYAKRGHVELVDVVDQHLLVYSPIGSGGSWLGTRLREAGLAPRRVSQIQLTEAILELVAAGLGVSVLAGWAVVGYLRRREVTAVRLTKNGIVRHWYAVSVRRSPTAALVKSFAAVFAAGPRVLPGVGR